MTVSIYYLDRKKRSLRCVQEIDVREVKQFAEGIDSEDRNGEADR